MVNVVYILGAGFSAPLGLPVMRDFWQKGKDMLRSDPVKFGYFREIFKLMSDTSKAQTYFEYPTQDIEEALSILEMRKFLGGEGDFETFKHFITDVITYHTPLIPQGVEPSGEWDRTIFGKNSVDERNQWFGYFVASLFSLGVQLSEYSDQYNQTRGELAFAREQNPELNYSVVTLNYDMVLENFCEFINKYLPSGFSKIGFSKNDEATRAQAFPSLAKIHGSVKDGAIIPPTYSKGLYQPDLPSSWKLAYALLLRANHIRIIGYSLPSTDAYIRYILKASISEADDLDRIDIICKDSGGKARERYREFIKFKNVRFAPKPVEDYLGMNYNRRGLDANRKLLSFNALERAHEDFFRGQGPP